MNTLFDTEQDRIAQEFEAFNTQHPEVYQAFKKFTMQLWRTGAKRGSARDVLGRVRWETQVNPGYMDFKVNNNYAAIMSRKLMEELPCLKDFFQTRERKSIDT